MKKILLLSSLALVLTACSTDTTTSQGSKPVNEDTNSKVVETTKSVTSESKSEKSTDTTTAATTKSETKVVSSSTSKVNIDEIASGNLSSIFGRYPSASQTIVIDENDTISLDKGASGELELGILGIQKQGNTAVISTQIKVDDVPQGAVVDGIVVKYIVVPAGEKSPVAVPEENVNKDRIIMQGHGIEVLYVN